MKLVRGRSCLVTDEVTWSEGACSVLIDVLKALFLYIYIFFFKNLENMINFKQCVIAVGFQGLEIGGEIDGTWYKCISRN